MRFEQAGAGRRVEVPGLPIDALQVQAALMLAAFRDAHHQPGIDTAHWERNSEEIQNAAMNEWVGDPNDPTSRAALYRAYADQHPYEHVDIEDDDSLEGVLAAIGSETKH